jgi:hypothetical protein
MTIPLLFGPYGSSALEYLDRFAQFQANAIWFHGFDAAAFEASAKHNIAACVEFKTFRVDFNAQPELIPIGVDGKPIRYDDLVQGVCLSQADFLAETEQHLLDGLRLYQPAGIWLDYLTYAGWFETPAPDLQDSCFCPACTAEFCQATGIDADTPQEILRSHPEAWERHKCERIASFASHYARLIREHQPQCIIGAYMCPWLPDEFNRALTRIFAQDYSLLAQSIDVFTPLIYVAKSGRGPEWGRQFLEAAQTFIPADRPVQLILDALDFPDSMVAAAGSTVPSYGIQLFGGAKVFSDPAQAKIFAQAVEQIQRNLNL